MPVWISLYLPTHSLDVCFPRWSNDTVAAVLVGGKIIACTPAAHTLGIQAGMSVGTAQSLAPGVKIAQENAQANAAYLDDIALSMLQYTPCVSGYRKHAILMEVNASLSLFKGARHVCHRIRATLSRMHVHAQLGMAPTALGAWVLSCQPTGRRRTLRLPSLHRKLDALPVGVLPAVQPYADWLEGIGCRLLCQLRKQPRQALQQRSSPLLMHDVDAAYGVLAEGFAWFEAPASFCQRHDLVERLEHSSAILLVTASLIEQLCGWLQSRQASVSALTLLLHHEKGRHARPPTSILLRLSENAWQPQAFTTVLREQLHQVVLPAPVISIELSASKTAARPVASASLFPEPTQWMSQERRLLDLLRARLGAEHVLSCNPVADHRPEQANVWRPIEQERTTTAAQIVPPKLPAHARPFWLLAPPQALSIQHNRPVYQSMVLRLIQGPERLESGWWSESGHHLRDYFVAQDPQGARYWIYRERETDGSGWFLHGLFG